MQRVKLAKGQIRTGQALVSLESFLSGGHKRINRKSRQWQEQREEKRQGMLNKKLHGVRGKGAKLARQGADPLSCYRWTVDLASLAIAAWVSCQ